MTPGAGIVLDFQILAAPLDTIRVMSMAPTYFLVGDGTFWWYPIGTELDTTFVVPEIFPVSIGDCDCSGIVTISDAVFMINYIFSGGIPPYDLNAADPNADCINSISDAVYLINYIFAGGPAPQAGCVVR